MDIRTKIIDLRISERVKGKKFIIYPFGDIGKRVKEILNKEYNLQEYAVVDSYCKENQSEIKSIEDFDEKMREEIIVILASDNQKYYDEIRNIVRRKFRFENVIDLSGAVNVENDRRIESLRLCANILNENGIEGAVAEAGVFEGDFAQYINIYFKDRKLYLFDTFEGFENEKLKSNVDECWEKWMEKNYAFNSSGVESVLKKMQYPENCIIRKGFFPQTAECLDETFCFVNIDMDIYQSTRDGLEYFWPRMKKRGIIFVHDYVSWNCPGVKKAVDEFCEKNGIGLVCLPEFNGTVVLVK